MLLFERGRNGNDGGARILSQALLHIAAQTLENLCGNFFRAQNPVRRAKLVLMVSTHAPLELNINVVRGVLVFEPVLGPLPDLNLPSLVNEYR